MEEAHECHGDLAPFFAAFTASMYGITVRTKVSSSTQVALTSLKSKSMCSTTIVRRASDPPNVLGRFACVDCFMSPICCPIFFSATNVDSCPCFTVSESVSTASFVSFTSPRSLLKGADSSSCVAKSCDDPPHRVKRLQVLAANLLHQ